MEGLEEKEIKEGKEKRKKNTELKEINGEVVF
jgi:hypothetical protein